MTVVNKGRNAFRMKVCCKSWAKGRTIKKEGERGRRLGRTLFAYYFQTLFGIDIRKKGEKLL